MVRIVIDIAFPLVVVHRVGAKRELNKPANERTNSRARAVIRIGRQWPAASACRWSDPRLVSRSSVRMAGDLSTDHGDGGRLGWVEQEVATGEEEEAVATRGSGNCGLLAIRAKLM